MNSKPDWASRIAARAVIWSLIALAAAAPALAGPREGFIAIQNQVRALQPELVKSVVNIRSGGGTGSGVIISKDGLILTAGHVIAGRRSSRVRIGLTDGRTFEADNLGFDRESDLGLVKITASVDLPILPIGDSATLRRGQWILAMGHPLGQKAGRPPVLRIGRVINLMRSRENPEPERIGTDAPLISGDSGGPVFDLNGRVVGINSMITSGGRRMASIHVPVNLGKAAIQAALKGEEPAGWNGAPEAFAEAMRNGDSALRAGDAPAALKAAKQAVAADPDSGVARLLLTRALLKSRQPGAAASALVEALDLGYNDSDALREDRELAPALANPAVARALDRVTAFNFVPGDRKGDRIILTAAGNTESNLARGVVRIRSADRIVALGTVMSADGDILSKASELPDGPLEAGLPDGRWVRVERGRNDSAWDLTLLKARAEGLQPLPLAESAGTGEWTFTPDSTGAVAALGIVGVAEMPVSERAITIKPTSKAYLGIRLEPLSPDDLKTAGVPRGVRVTVEPDLPAARAGVADGDVVFEADGHAVTDPDGFMDLMVGKQPGDSVSLRIARGEERLSLTVNLTTRPANLPGRGGLPEMLSGDVSRMQGPFPRVLQHDAVLRPNQMGGPILDSEGKMLGVNIARADRTSTYAIPSRDVKEIYTRLKSGK